MVSNLFFIIILLAGVILWWRWRQRTRRTSLELPAIPPRARSGCRRHFTGLQWRMTFSYVWITIASILLFFAVVTFIISFINTNQPSIADNIAVVKATAQQYASEVALQAQGETLGAVFPYPLGEKLQNSNPGTYTDSEASNLLSDTNEVPYLTRLYPANQPVSFALLIAPDLRVLSSSYPSRYSPGISAATLLPAQVYVLRDALSGSERQGTFNQSEGTMIYATATIWNKAKQPVGAIYVQVPASTLRSSYTPGWLSYIASWFLAALILLVVLAPLGGIFGFISTRGMVKRLKGLASATTLLADGDYQQRLRVGSRDELGQLEQQFNRMAEQLGASTARQKELAEENARLAERSRISRELHDAISQDLFSLSMLAGGLQSALPADSPLQRQASTLEQTTTTMIREMRALLLELRPTNLEALCLNEALEELASAYSTRVGIAVKTKLAPLHLEARLEHALLRIAQEALSNAARHANASEICLTLTLNGQEVAFSLKDNGQGFQTDDEGRRHGLGLRLMEERVQELNGTLELFSIPGQGTSLEVHLPLKEETL